MIIDKKVGALLFGGDATYLLVLPELAFENVNIGETIQPKKIRFYLLAERGSYEFDKSEWFDASNGLVQK